jgi:hypothetical protein
MSDLAKAVSGPEQIKETLREISEPHRTRKTPPPPREEPAAEEDASAGDQAVNRR